MKRLIYIFLLIPIIGFSQNQNGFSVAVSNDSILIGNKIRVEFILENVQGEFEAPSFEGMQVWSGPNTASSFQSINGKSTSTITYSYIVEPMEEGELIIDQAFLKTDDEVLETDFVRLNVYPNPDGIIQEERIESDDFRDFFDFKFPSKGLEKLNEDQPRKKQKKKYKLKKI